MFKLRNQPFFTTFVYSVYFFEPISILSPLAFFLVHYWLTKFVLLCYFMSTYLCLNIWLAGFSYSTTTRWRKMERMEQPEDLPATGRV